MVSAALLALRDQDVLQWSVLAQNRGVDIYKRDGFGLNISANMSWLLFPSAWHQQGLKALSTTPQFLLL